MNDPHVEKLVYRFASENINDKFDNAKTLKTTLGNFEVELSENILSAFPHDHYPDEDSARIAFEPLMHSSESTAFLSSSRFRIYFRYLHADIVDRNPTPGVINLHVHSAVFAMTAGEVTLIREMPEYPPPEHNFLASALSDELIKHIKDYLDGRIPLAAMTNWFETILRREYGSREEVSKKLNIDLRVLNTLGLLSTSSDPIYGRKEGGPGPSKLNSDEIKWLVTVVFVLVKRIGEINSGVTATNKIKMSDLL